MSTKTRQPTIATSFEYLVVGIGLLVCAFATMLVITQVLLLFKPNSVLAVFEKNIVVVEQTHAAESDTLQISLQSPRLFWFWSTVVQKPDRQTITYSEACACITRYQASNGSSSVDLFLSYPAQSGFESPHGQTYALQFTVGGSTAVMEDVTLAEYEPARIHHDRAHRILQRFASLSR